MKAAELAGERACQVMESPSSVTPGVVSLQAPQSLYFSHSPSFFCPNPGKGVPILSPGGTLREATKPSGKGGRGEFKILLPFERTWGILKSI